MLRTCQVYRTSKKCKDAAQCLQKSSVSLSGKFSMKLLQSNSNWMYSVMNLGFPTKLKISSKSLLHLKSYTLEQMGFEDFNIKSSGKNLSSKKLFLKHSFPETVILQAFLVSFKAVVVSFPYFYKEFSKA